MQLRDVSLEDKYRLDLDRAYMTGIEALARLPMLQHQRDRDRGLNTAGFISGYRGSPLGGVDQAMWRAQRQLREHNVQLAAIDAAVAHAARTVELNLLLPDPASAPPAADQAVDVTGEN